MRERATGDTREQRSASSAAVAVVGAGLSGLTAARALHRRGIDVVVLEAADRVGGRAMSEQSALGSRLDVGGQWIGHDHHRLIALADEMHAARFPMQTSTLPRVIDGPRRLSPASPALLVAGLVLLGVGALSLVGTPRRWNASTVEDWLRKVPGRRARRLLEVIALISWTADLDRFSVHAMAYMIRRQGGLRTILATKGGAQDSLLVDGAGTLVERLAVELGARVRSGTEVSAITGDGAGVVLTTTGGDVRARKVIVAVPPPIAARISFDPPLPPELTRLHRETYMGSVYKSIAVYHRPFWRPHNSGELVVLDRPGRAVFDTSPPDGPGHLCMLVGGSEARALDPLDANGRRKLLLDPLVAHLGPEVLEPVGWHEKAWHLDPHVGGGYVALPMSGTTSGLPPVAHVPVGAIHWAGSETAREHAGYLEGAIEAGERAAFEVAGALSAS